MHRRIASRARGISAAVISLGAAVVSCHKTAPAAAGFGEKEIADALHDVMAADRTIYAREVVDRLQDREKVFRAGEHWKEDKLLPLPAQMFRMGAELVRQKNKRVSYALISIWPINRQNAPRTDTERQGLAAVGKDPDQAFYQREALGGASYFTAVYADKAVTQACATCHNGHPDSARKDFKLGDTIGGVVIRLALD